MRAYIALSTLVWISCISGCATRTEVALRERAQRAEAEVLRLQMFIAGAQDDNAMLMKALAEQQGYIRALESGAQWQAQEMARIREFCEL